MVPKTSTSLWQFPVRSNKVAGISVRKAFQIALMFWLCRPERASRNYFGDDLAGPEARCIDIGHSALSHSLLLFIEIEDCRAVARTNVVALAVLRRRVMELKEELEDLTIADLARINHDLDSFGVRPMVAVGGVGHIAARVAYARGQHSLVISQQVLHAPEAAASKDYGFGLRRHDSFPPI